MSEADHLAAARGQRAALCDEFIGPILDELEREYTARIAKVAVSELNAKARTEKMTALGMALKMVEQFDSGLKAAIESGKLAERNILNAREMEKLGREQRRLRDIVGI